ncbi:MAG: HAD family phosphatase [Lachnospiraceae bacterium]|nr:HAD family phosphatase [Lachnospiraceae bacterium]
MKLIFLDIDGTLTPAGSNTPPKSAAEAVRLAREAGNKVFLCTGRNPDMLSPVLRYGFDGYIASGGGYVVLGDKVLFDCPMTEEQRLKALRLFRENDVYCTVEAKDASFGDEGLAEFLNRSSGGNSELVRWRKAIEKDLNIRPMADYDGRPLYKIVFMCSNKKQLEPAIMELDQEFAFIIQDVEGADCINGELVNRRFHKGTGVKLIADAMGVSLQDTIGYGDSMNDVDMIRYVGLGICMENGSPELKKLSDIVCPAVEDDGLYVSFRSLGLIPVIPA